ncbi:MAG: hypothetical protein Q7U48_13925 [Hydrogenophaga sp.]|nr:hypothetical protein [Hydrogenophaga sp.]
MKYFLVDGAVRAYEDDGSQDDYIPPAAEPITEAQALEIVSFVPELTQYEKDIRRYQRRASVKDQLMAFMAADNMSRVRSGAWTVPDLTGLIDDPAVAAAQSYMDTLSYELAAQAIGAATTPLLTAEIKANWVAKLTEHFYLVP